MTLDRDLFTQGRAAFAATQKAYAGHGFFESIQRYQPDGRAPGPEKGKTLYVESFDLAAMGGLAGAKQAGISVIAESLGSATLYDALDQGFRVWLRTPYRAGESSLQRTERLRSMQDILDQFSGMDALWPSPLGEPQGLDTLEFFSACRALFPAGHVLSDLVLLGHKLGQLCLTFGADELVGPIGTARQLRLGDNAQSHDVTELEARQWITAAGLIPRKRLESGHVAND